MSYLLNEVQGNIVSDQVSNVTTTFTSWEKCMLQTYCKWPAVTGIALGSLIALSIIICCSRCLCFGYSFCCSCFSCLSCCGCCRGCCSGRRARSDNYKIHPSSDYRNQGYSAPPPMMKGGINKSQYAHFPTNKASTGPVNEDALPAMPSWDTATSVHVLDETEDIKDVELKQITSSTSQQVPLVTAAATTGTSSPLIQEHNITPFQTRPSPNNKNGYMNLNDSNQRRTHENLTNQYSPNPYSENMFRESGPRYGGSSSPLDGRGYVPPIQAPYHESGRSTPTTSPYHQSGRSTPIQPPYFEGGRSTPTQVAYHEGGRSTPTQVPYRESGRSTPIQPPYFEGGRSTPTQVAYHEGGRSTPTQVPYHDGGRSANAYIQNRYEPSIPGVRTQGRERGISPQSQRTAIGYQGYRN